MAVIVSMEDYLEKVGTTEYLKRYACCKANDIPSHAQHMLRCYHEAFQNLPNDVKVLEYGAGPVIMLTISAAAKGS